MLLKPGTAKRAPSPASPTAVPVTVSSPSEQQSLSDPVIAPSAAVSGIFKYFDRTAMVHSYELAAKKDMATGTKLGRIPRLARWSPDTLHVAVTYQGDDEEGATWHLIDLTTGKDIPLQASALAWADNATLVTAELTDKGSVLKKTGLDGKGTVITEVEGDVSDLEVDRSGDKIAYVASVANQDFEIPSLAVFTVSTATANPVTDSVSRLIGWSDSGVLAYVSMEESEGLLALHPSPPQLAAYPATGGVTWLGENLVAVSRLGETPALLSIASNGSSKSLEDGDYSGIASLSPVDESTLLALSAGHPAFIAKP